MRRPFSRRSILTLALAVVLAACGVIGPSKESVENFSAELMPMIAEWRADALTPYGTEEFNKKIVTPDEQRLFVTFSKLGGLVNFQTPKMVGYSTATGVGTHVTVEIAATFEQGPALIRMVLRSSGGTLKLHALNIESPAFGNPSVQPKAVQQI